MEIAIVGGGASGFFSAITAKENFPDARVIIFEKSKKLLGKVKISGGGRCNVTNACKSIVELSEAYPRGGKALKKAFHIFNNKHAMQWFESRNVPLVIQDDNRVFPASQNSQTIIDCFFTQTKKLGIEIILGRGIKTIKQIGDKLELSFIDGEISSRTFDKVIVATGGSPERGKLEWLEKLHHKIKHPVPSLFTFNIPNDPVTKLMGIVVEKTMVSIQATKFKAEGSLLITHWGMSGPAILKLSALGARLLYEKGYKFNIQVNWANENNQVLIMDELNEIVKKSASKTLSNIRPFFLPDRLWRYLLEKSDLSEKKMGGTRKEGRKQVGQCINQ